MIPEKLEFAPDFWRMRAQEARRLATNIALLPELLLLSDPKQML